MKGVSARAGTATLGPQSSANYTQFAIGLSEELLSLREYERVVRNAVKSHHEVLSYLNGFNPDRGFQPARVRR
jgi:hypothetical protein